jgi:signal transduction histidine kinase/ActR/RegA family two-component response regulator
VSRQLFDLARSVTPLSEVAIGCNAREMFISQPLLRLIPVCNAAGDIIGVLERFSVLGAMSVGFGREIYERRQVSLLMRSPVPILQSNQSLEDAARTMADFGADAESMSAAVLMNKDVYIGVVDAVDVFRSLAGLLDIRAKELESARSAAEAAGNAKSNFLSAMSHEIRTPLNGIMGMAQALGTSALPPQQMQMVEIINSSSEVLLRLLNDVLDMSRVEAGKLDLDIRQTNLRKLIETAAMLFEERSTAKGLTFEVDVCALEPWSYECDGARIKQIVYNLISNAVKFTESGSVRVSATVDLQGDKRATVCISVTDTGIGMSAETIAKLFQPFSQADAGITREHGGSGLGLSISSAFVDLMGGQVVVESEVGKGSCFSVRLPLVPVPFEAPTSTSNAIDIEIQEHSNDVLRILVAEDNPTNRLVLKTLLGTFDAELTFAEDGLQAVEAYKAGRFDLVLMDLQMPNMDGLEATRAIRRLEKFAGRQRMPMLALSANAMAHHVDEALAAGLDGHVAKPIMLPKLLAAIETALENADDGTHHQTAAA